MEGVRHTATRLRWEGCWMCSGGRDTLSRHTLALPSTLSGTLPGTLSGTLPGTLADGESNFEARQEEHEDGVDLRHPW